MAEHSWDKAQQGIADLDKAWSDAAKAAAQATGDARLAKLKDVIQFYSEKEGGILWPDQGPFFGRPNILNNWKTVMDSFPGMSLEFKPRQIHISGELASDYGEVDLGYDGPKGRVSVQAKYLVVWKKEAGAWKVLYDCWNYNAPQS